MEKLREGITKQTVARILSDRKRYDTSIRKWRAFQVKPLKIVKTKPTESLAVWTPSSATLIIIINNILLRRQKGHLLNNYLDPCEVGLMRVCPLREPPLFNTNRRGRQRRDAPHSDNKRKTSQKQREREKGRRGDMGLKRDRYSFSRLLRST